MKAAILKAIGQPLSVEEVPDPVLAPDEVLVETRACGICRTDLHIQDGLAYTFPVTSPPASSRPSVETSAT
jgi:D-arabinose 1-dehydrogenase-like Zn-dependent alcohol dehydrogenase